ncbi:MAG TPA: histidine kinase [Chitinophagales bacterium]|nr:histidine kinase [Chitinophagales bacterium]
MTDLRRSGRRLLLTYLLLFIVCTTLGVLFFIFIYYSENGSLNGLRTQGSRHFSAILLTNIIGLLVFHGDRLLDRIIHWQKNFILRFVTGLVAHAVVGIVLLAVASDFLFKAGPAGYLKDGYLKIAILFVISIFIYEIFYGLFYSYRYYAVTQTRQLQSERWQMELQFESLKSQISPHYLFNCLNTVSSLLYKDSSIAEQFIRRMADTFRYVLSHQKQKLVLLREEIEFVKSYYFLLQVRYEYHLQLEINVPQNMLDTLIPPMTLQLLVENAVKHNAISRDQPLLVYISAQDNTALLVTNNKTRSVKPTTSFRVGLENIHKRYSFFTREKVKVIDEDKFLVHLPVIKNSAGLDAA